MPPSNVWFPFPPPNLEDFCEDGTSLSFEDGKYAYNSQSGSVVDKTFDATKYKPICLDVAAELDVIAKLR